ncbi:MAG: tetratricopeptide repeat protein [Phycisphaerales bacterium]|nr:tetratricopeptide repeat protein [Phycisphaerales bacterium]
MPRICVILLMSSILGPIGCQQDAEPSPEVREISTPVEVVETPPLDESLTNYFRLIESGATGPARVRIRQWLDEFPTDSRGLFLMGLSHHQDKHYARAVSWLKEAIAAKPVYPPAWHFLGWTQYYLGQPDEARAAFLWHIGLDPEEGDSHFALGLLDLDEWRLNDAESRFRTAMSLQESIPGRAKGVSKAAARLSEVIEYRDQDVDRAIELLKQSVRLYPDHYEAWYRLWQLLDRQHQFEDAERARLAFVAARDRVRPGSGFPE